MGRPGLFRSSTSSKAARLRKTSRVMRVNSSGPVGCVRLVYGTSRGALPQPASNSGRSAAPLQALQRNGNDERDRVEEAVNDHPRIDAVNSAAQIREPKAKRREDWKRVDQAVRQP